MEMIPLIQLGFDDALRAQAAALYDEAFGAKLAVATPARAARLALLAEAFDPTQALVALSGDQLLGIAGFKTARGALTSGLTLARLRRHLGMAGALRALAVLALLQRPRREGELLMDGIAVAPAARGGGIGSRLLAALIERAAGEGYHSIRLDVIDTNPGARRLYERMGFVPTRVARLGLLKWLFGFSAATTLEFRVERG
jgi:ribosomal protein S18 acetylase RimI-like enzyme